VIEHVRIGAEPPLFYARKIYNNKWAGLGMDMLAMLAMCWAPNPVLKLFFVALIRMSSYLPMVASCLLTAAFLVNVWSAGTYSSDEHLTQNAVF
jgi:hypothetical protein